MHPLDRHQLSGNRIVVATRTRLRLERGDRWRTINGQQLTIAALAVITAVGVALTGHVGVDLIVTALALGVWIAFTRPLVTLTALLLVGIGPTLLQMTPQFSQGWLTVGRIRSRRSRSYPWPAPYCGDSS